MAAKTFNLEDVRIPDGELEQFQRKQKGAHTLKVVQPKRPDAFAMVPLSWAKRVREGCAHVDFLVCVVLVHRAWKVRAKGGDLHHAKHRGGASRHQEPHPTRSRASGPDHRPMAGAEVAGHHPGGANCLKRNRTIWLVYKPVGGFPSGLSTSQISPHLACRQAYVPLSLLLYISFFFLLSIIYGVAERLMD
jgi:hypothetical protein